VLQNATSVLLINAIYQVLQPLHSLTLMLQSPKMLLTEVPLRVRNVSSTLGPTCITLDVRTVSVSFHTCQICFRVIVLIVISVELP